MNAGHQERARAERATSNKARVAAGPPKRERGGVVFLDQRCPYVGSCWGTPSALLPPTQLIPAQRRMRTCAVVAAVGLVLPSAAGFVAPNAGVIKVSHTQPPITLMRRTCALDEELRFPPLAGAAMCLVLADGKVGKVCCYVTVSLV